MQLNVILSHPWPNKEKKKTKHWWKFPVHSFLGMREVQVFPAAPIFSPSPPTPHGFSRPRWSQYEESMRNNSWFTPLSLWEEKSSGKRSPVLSADCSHTSLGKAKETLPCSLVWIFWGVPSLRDMWEALRDCSSPPLLSALWKDREKQDEKREMGIPGFEKAWRRSAAAQLWRSCCSSLSDHRRIKQGRLSKHYPRISFSWKGHVSFRENWMNPCTFAISTRKVLILSVDTYVLVCGLHLLHEYPNAPIH